MDTLVDGVTYFVTDETSPAEGLYHGDTRHLSALGVTVDDTVVSPLAEQWRPPRRRTRQYADVNYGVNVISESVDRKHATTVLERHQTVSEGRLVERFELQNFRGRTWSPRVDVTFDADFRDVFEVRGMEGTIERDPEVSVDSNAVTYSYSYPTASSEPSTATLRTQLTFDESPETLEPGVASFEPTLGPGDSWSVAVEVEPGGDVSTVGGRGKPAGAGGGETAGPLRLPASFDTGDPAIDQTLEQAVRDLRALTTRTAHGQVPLAGAPWFVTVFGRDAILAAYLLLPVEPDLARGTLRYLAAHQGTEWNERRDEAPGKILHEVRCGELSRTDRIPQTPYYGTVDTTPLWLVLLHETWRWTGDDTLVEELRPNFDAALEWVERASESYGDDPFIYYQSSGSAGVVHKVWRDSANGVHYADGRQATPPLACPTVQGYAYDALERSAEISAAVFDDRRRSKALERRADRLAERFDDAFWMPDCEHYAAALSGDGESVDALTSNVGHCLWSGIVASSRAEQVADALLGPDLFSGWGVRTTSSGNDGYSPVSYHAGSVWPHDNAIVTLGLARAGFREAVRTVSESQFGAFSQFEHHSVPELFCGFDATRPVTPHPSGCRPQAWAAAAPFGFLRALFDFEPNGGSEPAVREDPETLSRTAVEPLLERWR